MNQCWVCHSLNPDRAHIKTKGSGGPDDDFNIMYLCRFHHSQQHKIGILTFISKYPIVKLRLIQKGWELKPVLWHPKLATHNQR